MRLLHLVHQYMPDHVGGTELYTQTVATRQAAAGHTVSIVCPANLNPVPLKLDPAIEQGVRVYRLPVGQRSRTRVFLDTFRQQVMERAFETVLAREQPDLVHIQHLMGLPVSLVERVAAAGIPYVVTLHDYWYGCANGQLITNTDQSICPGPDPLFLNCARCGFSRAGLPGQAAIAWPLAPVMGWRNGRLRRVLQGAQAVIAPTQFVKETYSAMGLPDRNMIVVRHGIEVDQARITAARVRRQPTLQPGLRIGFVGSIAWQKGVDCLITAVNGLPVENVSLTLYGGLSAYPEYVAALQAAATHPGIRFAGRIARKDLWAALVNCDVVVLPTRWYEASPLTIDEIFAAGVPIVASRIGAMTEKINDGVDGILTEPGNVRVLQEVLQSLRDDPERLRALQRGIRPVRLVEEHLEEIAAVYTRVLQDTSSASLGR